MEEEIVVVSGGWLTSDLCDCIYVSYRTHKQCSVSHYSYTFSILDSRAFYSLPLENQSPRESHSTFYYCVDRRMFFLIWK